MRKHLRRSVFTAIALTTTLVLTACGGGSTDEPGGIDISTGTHHINLVAYAVPKVGFDEIIPAFRETEVGSDIGFSQSYGASGDQSRKVARHVPADVVNFSVEPDITRLVKAGLVNEDWKSATPHNSTPFGSVVALVVRAGNPKNIHTWSDLLQPGVEVITPNPASSGSAKWNLLAPYSAASNGGQDPTSGLAYVSQLVRDHIKVNPKSGREATTTFQSGQGDVLISYENEAIFLTKQNATSSATQQIEYVLPPVTFQIENPMAVVNTSENLAQANDFLQWQFTDEAQHIWAEAGFRPVVPEVIAETADLFPGATDKIWTIKELGAVLGKGIDNGRDKTGWAAVDQVLFGAKGAITAIYDKGGSTT